MTENAETCEPPVAIVVGGETGAAALLIGARLLWNAVPGAARNERGAIGGRGRGI